MILWFVVGFVGWLGISMVVHEFLHLETAKRLGYNAKITFFKYGMNTVVKPFPNKKDDLKILAMGFLGGLGLVFLYVISMPSEILAMTMLGLYLFFTRDDARQIFFIKKTERLTK